ITAVQNITKNLNDTQFNPKNTPLNASDLKKQFNKESNFSKSLMSKEFDTKLMDPKIVNKVIESHNKK
ncbi:MAG: hypothetical protein WCJ39_05310, partial [bacterium]